MSSKAFSGVGTKFQRWNATSHAWESLAEVNSINGPTKTRAFIDVTSLDSTGGYKEFITGFRDAGTLSLKMNFTRDSYDKMNADFEAAAAQNYQILLPDTEHTALEFEGLVTEVPITIPTDDKVTADVTIKVTGPVLINSGGSTGI
jgi:predicted secreted protein